MLCLLLCLLPMSSKEIKKSGDPTRTYEKEERIVDRNELTPFFEYEDWEGINHLYTPNYGFDHENILQTGLLFPKDQEQLFSDIPMLDNFQFNMGFLSIQQSIIAQDFTVFHSDIHEIPDLVEEQKDKRNKDNLDYERRSNELQNEVKFTTVDNGGRCSTEEVFRVAGARFIRSSAKQDDDMIVISKQFDCSISSLSDDECKDVELAQLLLASAESVNNKQFDLASRLLTQCDYLSSTTGNSVQRVVYYFAEGLRDRIGRETGRIPFKLSEGRGEQPIDVEEAMMTLNPALLACHQTLPFGKVLQFAGIQAIVDSVASAMLMQALASRHQCPIELLKITAVGTLRQPIEETGKRLETFPESMSFPFKFEVLIISDLNELEPESFEIEADEAVAVYCPLFLRTMIITPDRLETLMRVVRNLNPCVMVVTEIEGNHNSPSFVNRFIETLFYYGAVFYCMATCMNEQNYENRIVTERFYYGQAINNIVSTEGEERTFRHVGVDIWRAFFTRYGMVETELSQSNLYQADLILKQVPPWSSCSLDMNGECLILRWKGTPMSSISAWKARWLFSGLLMPEDAQFNVILSPIQSFQEPKALQSVLSGVADIAKPNSQTSLNKLKGVRLHNHQDETEITDAVTGRKLSPHEIVSQAGARFIELSTKKNDDRDIIHSTQFLTVEEIRDIELVKHLLASAEAVSNELFDTATKLANQCVFFSPIHKVTTLELLNACIERLDNEKVRLNDQQGEADSTTVNNTGRLSPQEIISVARLPKISRS
ncbi:hypothetical protein MKW94_010054 [Papaver nudicaule]|uniref:Uncharacterized protein n=1 Tax=Papaver nudicaule TaxID=74823 RepID=A0AA41RR13_PAPNU|nr:hypothetical protein [Papaver nudicaule]